MKAERWDDWMVGELRALDAAGLTRRLRPMASADGRTVVTGGKLVLSAAGNGYLGLAHDPEVLAAARTALETSGASSQASRLVAGDHPLHHALEHECAELVGLPCALAAGSGYLANVGLLRVLGRDATILSDERNHASIVDGCRAAGARAVRRYRHGDAAEADRLLEETAREGGRALLVTESLFSVDGDLAPLAELGRSCAAHGALFVVDEAHGLGVAGATGRGGLEEAGRPGGADAVVGTLGKALGGYGAFVACSPELRALLVTRLRTTVYSTALPPAVLGGCLAAVRRLRRDPALVQRLQANARALRARLAAAGFRIPGEAWSPIVPVVLGDNRDTLAAAARLLEAGVLVAALRPPTVPEGTARLRLSVSAAHTAEDVETIAAAVIRCVPGRRGA
ncbi:MAG: 8-amino-7-oxononanoate synthase [Deltaproteobacteria bacterium]|nr:8-amino-7-oxononanoate synthase [Deltaproteobacteria bacterium]